MNIMQELEILNKRLGLKNRRGITSNMSSGFWLGGGGPIGGWKELARTTLGAGSDTITVSSLADKRYYMALYYATDTGGSINANFRLNTDTATNYADRISAEGGADSTDVSLNRMAMTAANSHPFFGRAYFANKSTKEKLMINHTIRQNTAGEANAPGRAETVGKHAQTSNPISEIQLLNQGTGDFATNSELVILGWDQADTHTTNFWGQLDDFSWSSGSSFSSSTFAAKKYLWIKGYVTRGSSPTRPNYRFNADSGNNYATRLSTNGGADSTFTSNPDTEHHGGAGTIMHDNLFIINVSSQEKLIIGFSVYNGGSGAGTAPDRIEWVSKWVNTSSQITSMTVLDALGNAFTGGQYKVWGSD